MAYATAHSEPALDLAAQRTDCGDVVFAFSYLTWAAASRRGWFGTEDRLARGLVGNQRVERLLECDRTRSLPIKLVGDPLRSPGERFPASPRMQLLSPVRLRRRDPRATAALERGARRYDRAMQRAAARMGMTDPVVITTNPMLAGLAELAWARAVTYYALDDWPEHPGYSRWHSAYRDSYDGIRARRRRVAAVSQTLLERVAPTAAGRVIANGLEPEEWRGDPAPPKWATALPRPLLVYVGTLDQRLDIAALHEVASTFADAMIVLVGPLVTPQRFDSLRALGNVQIRPPVGRRELAGLIRVADAGLVPHERSPLTEAMSPLKVFEYLAGGLPVAASDLTPMHGIDPAVIRVAAGESFAGGVRRALERGRSSEPGRVAFIEANSWAARHDALLDLAFS